MRGEGGGTPSPLVEAFSRPLASRRLDFHFARNETTSRRIRRRTELRDAGGIVFDVPRMRVREKMCVPLFSGYKISMILAADKLARYGLESAREKRVIARKSANLRPSSGDKDAPRLRSSRQVGFGARVSLQKEWLYHIVKYQSTVLNCVVQCFLSI